MLAAKITCLYFVTIVYTPALSNFVDELRRISMALKSSTESHVPLSNFCCAVAVTFYFQFFLTQSLKKIGLFKLLF